MGAFSTAERDQLAKAIFSRICLRERYDKTGGQWVTIGGGPGPGGKQHAGGTPVKIGADGKIAAGPDKLEGKHIDHVDQDKKGAGAFDAEGRPAVGRGDRPAWQGLAEEGDAAAKAGDLDKAQRRWKAAAAAHPGGAEHPEAAELSKRTGAPTAEPAKPKNTDADVIRKSLEGVLGGAKPEAAKSGFQSLIDRHPVLGKYADSFEKVPKTRGGTIDQLTDEQRAVYLDLADAKTKGQITRREFQVGLAAIREMEPGAGPAQKPQEGPAAATSKDTAPSPATQETPNQGQHGVKEFDDFKLRGGREVKPIPKGRQLSLFDKLAQEGSPEAREMPTAAAIARGDGVHRLKNEHGEEPPAGVSVGDGGIWKGTATLHASDIQMDPSRFQYKVSGIGSKGVTKQLADVRRFNPMFGGQLLVWRDPENGKTFVINGHHRLELAQRSEHYEDETTGLKWQGELQSYFIPAKTAEQARAIGALANMAAGHGTATDAAKFMRDTGLGVDDLKGQGISLRGKIATDALALKDLSPGAFDQMVQGMLPESRAIAVSKHLKNPDQQDKLLRKLAERERGGRPVSDEAAAEAAKEMELAGTTSMRGGPGLFGDMDDEHSLEIERGEVKAAIRKSLASERNTFKAVSSTKRATKIQEAGSNVLDVEGNRQRAQRADESLGMFDKLANSRGNLSEAIQAAAEQYYHEPGKRDAIIGELVKRLPEIIDQQWGDFVGGGSERYSAAAGHVPRGVYRGGPVCEGSAGAGHARAGYSGAGSGFEVLRRAIDRALTAAAVRPVLERYSAHWDESKHSRGQPGNSGQFGPGGGRGESADSGEKKDTSSPPKSPASKGSDKHAADSQPAHATPAVAKVEKRFPPANPDGSDTLERHRTAGGEFTPERKALHEQIRAKVRAGVPRSDEPTFFMMGGGPASGKSSILDAGMVELPKAVHIDADAIKAELPEYQEMVAAKDSRAASYAHEESSEVGSQIRDESFAAGQNVLLDGTGNASVDSVRKKVEKARKAGYKVKAQYVSCATDEAVRRSMERAKETGRMVPESFIRHCHASVSRVLPEAVAQGLFDDCQLWDTEHRDDKGRPTLVMSAAGAAVTVHHPELWSKFIQKGTADAS